MPLEIFEGRVSSSGRSRCGGCFSFAESLNVGAGSPVIVKLNSETDRSTKLGGSSNFGSVVVTHSFAVTCLGEDKRVHLKVPITEASEYDKVRASGLMVVIYSADAHDLKSLP